MLGAWRNHLLWGMQLTWLGSMVGSDRGSRPGETGRPGLEDRAHRAGTQAGAEPRRLAFHPRWGEMLDRRRECLVASGAHLGSWGFGEEMGRMALNEYKPGAAFPGVIGRTTSESSPAWPQPVRAAADAPTSVYRHG